MVSIRQISMVSISLVINEKSSLFLMMGSDGLVNRQGAGEEDSNDARLFIGQVNRSLFTDLIGGFRDEVLLNPGTFVIDEIVGKKCLLSIGFSSGADEVNFKFEYGTDSEGPPGEICDFVERAVELTDPWYEKQCAA